MNNTTAQTTFSPSSATSKAEDVLTLAVYITTFILGAVGNFLVFGVIFTKKERKTPNDVFLVNLAAADLTAVSISLPVKLYQLFPPYLPANDFVCKVVIPMVSVPYCASIFTITSMAIHRRRTILNPWKGIANVNTTLFWVLVIWTCAFLTLLPISILYTAQDGHCMIVWTLDEERIYVVAIFLIQYIIPLSIISVAYIQICLNLKKYQKRIERVEVRRENLEITRTIAVIVVLFAVFTLPLQVFWLYLEFSGGMITESMQRFHQYAELLTDFHSCLNPLVYGVLTRRFRTKYTVMLSSVFKFFEKSQREFRSNESDRNRHEREHLQLEERRHPDSMNA